MIVVDASVVLMLLLKTGEWETLADRILDPGQTVHAPELLDLEVAQVLRRYASAGEITADRGSQALTDLPVERYPHTWMLPGIWELRENVTAYDAAYIVLAEALGAPLLTADVRLKRAPNLRAQVEVFPVA